MQTQKMSLANIQGKLSRNEMKNIMAGSGAPTYKCCIGTECTNCSENQYTCGPKATRTAC